MTVFGVDYAFGGPPDAAVLRAAGVQFVCRYLAPLPNDKVITAAEARALSDAGVWIVLVFEWTAQRALAGKTAGVDDARLAWSQAQALGMPVDRPIYFAVDFDVSPSQMPAVLDYLRGAASVLGKQGTGVYGSYSVVKAALDAGVCAWAWQTYGWSAGQWDPRAQLQQYSNGHSLGGVDVDYNRATAADYGQWRVGVAPPAPHPQEDPPVKRILAVGGTSDHVVPAGKDNGLPFEHTYLDAQKLMSASGYTCSIKTEGDYIIFARATISGLKAGDRVHLYVAGMGKAPKPGAPLPVAYEVHGVDVVGDGRDGLEVELCCPDVLHAQPYQVRLRNPNGYDVTVTSARQFRLAQ